MNYIITESFLDMGNKYRTRVIISDTETVFLSFDHFPTQEEVNVSIELELAERARPVVIPPRPEVPPIPEIPPTPEVPPTPELPPPDNIEN